MTTKRVRLLKLRASLRKNESGVAFMEFAFALPFLMVALLGGLELVHLALTHQQLSRIATSTADLAARYRASIDEVDVNTLFMGSQMSASFDDFEIAFLGRVRCQRDLDGGLVLGRDYRHAFEPRLDVIEQGIDCRFIALLDAADEEDFLIDVVEHDDDARDDEQGFRHVQCIFARDRHRFDMLDHVVTDIAERARGHRGQGRIGFSLRETHKVAQGLNRIV